jgi:signal transduction histidine kinase
MNRLLLDLHTAAEQVAAPLDVRGVAKWAFDRLETEHVADVAAVLLREPTTGGWRVAETRGLRASNGDSVSLPRSMREAFVGEEPVLVGDLGGGGLAERSTWGLYAPLRARDEVLGVLVLESSGEALPLARDLAGTADLARTAALALDNARWLERIHVFAVEQERARLARDLHDRIGQSVVYLGFEVDRLAQLDLGQDVQRDLLTMRADLRTLVGELRDTLVDLRSDISEEHDVADLLRSFVDRVNRRGKVAATLASEASARLPVMVERELWRIAQEAVMNAERHSGASHVAISWTCDEHGAQLQVADDGVGLDGAEPDPTDATSGYGLLGMRERADAIRARLQVVSHPGLGTTVQAQWGTG